MDIACDPSLFVYSPNPTVEPPGAPSTEDLIKQTGPVPVLLSWGDSDVIAPIYNDELHYQYWLQNCRCDVSRLYLPDTGHLFQVHESLDLWVSWVTTWLSDRGLEPSRASAAPATAAPLDAAGPTRGTAPAAPKTVAPDAARTATVRAGKSKRCVVPRLKGLTVAAATAKLAKANCNLGRTRARAARGARPGRVVGQSRKPAARLRAGTAVNLVIAKRSRAA